MTLAGQPPPSPALAGALALLARGRTGAAREVVTAAAKGAKGLAGSGSHPLARAYADMGRLNYRLGKFKRAAAEFEHACKNPLPPDPEGRRDRLAFMFGYAACLAALDRPADAGKVFRQCAAFARNLHGPAAPASAAALEPLAAHLLRTGECAEAARLLDEAYDLLWRLGDRAITAVIPTRAVAFKAVGRPADPFADLDALPADLTAEVVAGVLALAGGGDGPRVRGVLADFVRFADRRFGDAHPTLASALAAVVRHETALGPAADAKARTVATRRAVWGHLTRRGAGELVGSLEVGFEPDGTVHLVPHLTRPPTSTEADQLEATLTRAVEDLYARQGG